MITDFINIKILDMNDQLPAEILPSNRLLTAAEFHKLADVPPEIAFEQFKAARRRGYPRLWC